MSIILDLDGVLVDFCSAAYAAHGRTCAINEPACYDFFEEWGLSADQFWEPIDAKGPEFWADLPKYPWFDELVSLCRRPTFVIATTPSHHANSTYGKVLALQKLFGAGFRDYCITPRKWQLASPSRILIDDNEDNCRLFRETGGHAILFPSPWNENREHAGNRLGYVTEQLQALGRS